MKKKLLLMTVALMCAVGSWAQTWTSGAAAADDGEFYLYNIGADRFLNRGGTWSTHAIVDGQGVVIKLDEKSTDVYSIYTGVNSKYLNGDYTDGAETNWTLESVTVAGYTNVYKLKNTDSKYSYWVGGGSGSWGNEVLLSEAITEGKENNYYWLLIPKTTRQNFANASITSPLDVTYLITNPDFEYQLRDDPGHNNVNGDEIYPWTSDNGRVTNGWTTNNFWRQNSEQTFANGIFFEKYSGEGLTTADKIYQNVSLSAVGKYRLSCTAYSRNVNYYLYAGDQSTKITDSDTYSVDFVVSSAGSVEIGTKIETGSTGDWVAFDNVRLSYIDPYISVVADDFTSGSEMAAGKWYKFTVASAGDYGFDVIDGVVLTTNGSQLLSEATGDALTHDVALTTGTTYYIKSATAQTVTKTSSPYTYTIGTASSDKSYIQAGNIVTISYASMATTNTYTSEIDSEISGVSFGGNAISVTRTTKGFSFTVPTVTAGSEYTLAIPANIIGYQATGSGKNEAQNITLKTPAVLDGVYYFKANSTWNASTRSVTAACGKYLARGNSGGTRATIDKYGLPIIVTTTADNTTTLQPADTEKYFYHWSSWDCWADRDAAENDAKFNITLHDGEYRIHNATMTSGRYLKYNTSAVNDAVISVFDDGNGTNSGPIINWTFETPAEHAIVMAALKDAQASTAATAADAAGLNSLSGVSSLSSLTAKLATDEYDKAYAVAPSDITSAEEKFKDTEKKNKEDTPKSVYSGSVEISTPGLYRFSLQAFYRAATNAKTQPMHEGGYDLPHVVLYFGDAETQIKSVYDESSSKKLIEDEDSWEYLKYNDAYYPNSKGTALKAFQADMYHNDVFLYVSAAGTYNYGVKYLGWAGDSNEQSQWFCYTPQSASITLYTEADADDSDKTALLAAINGKVLGFENGEYAPYNNVDAVQILNHAKEVYDNVDALKWEVNDAISAIGAATWTANAGEVNAFCGGDFSRYQTLYNSSDKRDEDYPYGWDLYHGESNRSRIMGGTEGSNNSGLSAASSGKALLLKFNGTYGEREGYTMPLKAGKIYKITFKHGRWAEGEPRITNVVMTDPSGASISLAPGFQAENNNCQSNSENWYTYTGYFVSTTAGDYKFKFEKELNASNQNTQMQIAIADIDLRTADALELSQANVISYAAGTYPTVTIADRTLFDTDKWNSLCLPFDIPASTFGAVQQITDISVNGEKVILEMSDATGTLSAGTAYFVKAAENGQRISATNVTMPVYSENPSSATLTKGNTTLEVKGNYKKKTINNSGEFFLGTDNKFYCADTDYDITVNGYRAIFAVSTANPVKQLVFGDDLTGLNEVEGNAITDDATIYNLAGQRVNKAQKGIYIVNGKKVLVK